MKAAAARTTAEIAQLPLSGLAKANALIYAAASRQPSGVGDLTAFLAEVVDAVNGVDLDQTLREINEDRELAGFPPVNSKEVAEEVLGDRRQAWRRSLLNILDHAPSIEMAESMFDLVEKISNDGDLPRFLHDLIDDYALRAQPFMATELAGAERIVAKARELAASRPDALQPLFGAIEEMLQTWEELTRPIQMSATLRGRTDAESERLAFMIRSLSIDLFNDYDLLEQSRQVSVLVGSRFTALPRIADKIEEDTQALDNLSAQAREKNAKIAYAADIGTFGKSRLAISLNGLEWQKRLYPLESVTAARWGAIRKSVNGIPTGTDYLISWTDGRSIATVEFSNGVIYDAFVERLWRALAEHVIEKIIAELLAGRQFPLGNAIVRDGAVVLRRSKLFSSEAAEFGWGDVSMRTADGSLIIDGPRGSKATASMSYRDVLNVHFFEILIKNAITKGRSQLSDAFR